MISKQGTVDESVLCHNRQFQKDELKRACLLSNTIATAIAFPLYSRLYSSHLLSLTFIIRVMQTMTGSIPTIDSILHLRDKVEWEGLHFYDSTYELVHLHRRFWIQGEAGNTLLNPLEPEDEGDDDDDIGPNCHILDIGIPTLGLTKLWIRNEYIRMYKHCEDHLETNRNESKSPAMVVTGQPGIGKCFTLSYYCHQLYRLKEKSHWIHYVLCRRLAEKKPVLWYRDSRLYLFVSDGVYESPTNLSSALFRTRVWTLVDTDNETSFPPVLSQPGTNNLIIFATPPKKERWASLEKTTTWDVAIMNPWTRREISEALAHSLLFSMFKLMIFL